jgi:hypothetical protein
MTRNGQLFVADLTDKDFEVQLFGRELASDI